MLLSFSARAEATSRKMSLLRKVVEKRGSGDACRGSDHLDRDFLETVLAE
jgi:hypothetical protein